MGYRYYEGGVSSVYFWNLDDGFAGVVLLKKCTSPHILQSTLRSQITNITNLSASTATAKDQGTWDSIHVFEAFDRARTAHYKLTSTVILNLVNKSDAVGQLDLSGNMTRQIESDLPVEDDTSHIVNIGRLVEDMELKMRNLLRMYLSPMMFLVGFKDGWR